MLTILGGSPSNPTGGPGGSGGQGGPQTITVTAPGESAGNPGGSQGQGTTPCTDSGLATGSNVNTVGPTGPNNGPGGNGNGGSSPTAVTITVPENPSGGPGGNGGNSVLPTITVTAGNPSDGSGSGNGGGASLPSITLTAPNAPSEGSNGGPGGQGLSSNPAGSGQATVTVSNPGGYGGSPSAQPSGGSGESAANTGAGQGTLSNAATLTDVPPAGGYGAGHPTPQASDSADLPGVPTGPGGQGVPSEAATLTVVSTNTLAPTRTVTLPEGESGALPTDTATASRAPWSAVPTSGWNASSSGAQSPVDISSTPCPETTESVPAVSVPPISLPPPVSAPPESLSNPAATEGLSQLPTGASVGCVSMTTMTMVSRTFSWCAQVATSQTIDLSAAEPEPSTFIDQSGSVIIVPPQTAAPATTPGGYAFSARDNIELPVPSTLSTVIVRSLSSVPGSATESSRPAPSTCGNKADMGDFTFNVSGKFSTSKSCELQLTSLLVR